MRITVAALIALAIAPSGFADTIATVRETLRKLTGSQNIRGTLNRESRRGDGEKKLEVGHITTTVEANGEGVIIRCSVGEIARLRKERTSVDLDPEDALAMLHYAPVLLEDLEGAVVTSESQSARNGIPARVLDVKLKVRLDEDDKKRVKEASRTMKLWVDANGNPLYAEIVDVMKARIVLVSMNFNQRTSMTFGVFADHLAVVSEARDNAFSGLGQKSNETRTTTLKVH